MGFFLVSFSIAVGSLYLITRPRIGKAEKKGKELLEKFRNNSYDVRKILGEMRYIAEVSFEMFDEYNINKANGNNSLLYGLTHSRKQKKLVLGMNHNVKAEWIPRFKYLNENQNLFDKHSDLYNAFKTCREIDKGIRKLSLWNINLTNLYEDTISKAKFAVKVTAFGVISGIAVVGVMQGMLNNAGRDIGYSPKSNAWFRDEEGNLYDENYKKVPF